VRRLTLPQAILLALVPVLNSPPSDATLIDLKALLARHPERAIVVFLEYATTKGKGMAPHISSFLTVTTTASVFPISIWYTPQDVVTQIPGAYLMFLWNLLSRPVHRIRVHIAEDIRDEINFSRSYKTNRESTRIGARRNGNRRRVKGTGRDTSKRLLGVLSASTEE
jgi:1-acylglycerol-3-phosphate O-acyltransferase